MTNEQDRVSEELIALAESGDLAGFLALARDLQPADLSDVLAALEEEVRLRLVQTLPPRSINAFFCFDLKVAIGVDI